MDLTFVGLVVWIVTVILYYAIYRRSRDPVFLYIGVAFGLFGLSYLTELLGVESEALRTGIASVACLILAYVLLSRVRIPLRKPSGTSKPFFDTSLLEEPPRW